MKFAFMSLRHPTDEQLIAAAAIGVVLVHPCAAIRLWEKLLIGVFERANLHIYDFRFSANSPLTLIRDCI